MCGLHNPGLNVLIRHLCIELMPLPACLWNDLRYYSTQNAFAPLWEAHGMSVQGRTKYSCELTCGLENEPYKLPKAKALIQWFIPYDCQLQASYMAWNNLTNWHGRGGCIPCTSGTWQNIFACLAEWLMLPAEGIVWVPFHISNALKLLQHL